MRESTGSFMENLRWKAFFMLDKRKGGFIGNRFEQVKTAYRIGTSMADTKARIRQLIDHAVATTDFYKPYGPGAELQDLPVVNKTIFKEQYEAFQSSRYKGAEGNRIMSTSGSTGTPFAMIQNKEKASSNTADSIFMGTLANYFIGQKQAFVRVWVNNVKKSKLRLMMENSMMIDSSSLKDERLEEITQLLIKGKVRCLVGYASALGELGAYIKRQGVDPKKFRISSVIPISENMPVGTRRMLSELFDAPVRSWYSNEENGIMGVQTDDEDEAYYINSESYYYEILKMDSDEPAEDGELGRIVITDLTNYAFPVIRYDNGDTAVACHEDMGDGRFRLFLKELYGRRSDLIYDTKGRAVTPYLITNNMWDVAGVDQFRFIQKDVKDYELRLNGDQDKMDIADMLGRIRPTLGEDANIDVVFVDEIPVLASGKRKYIENICPAYKGR
ncbi:MAG: phenylacetate--CoA ligase family protein [Lachnospiraceae bacterium]|nr:phenylacetate--CoA ligase family protein [Lachnospiraceae bacterium]